MYLDTRRSKKNGKYPVKLRVFTSIPRKQKLYPTKFEFTKDEFKSIWETSKPRTHHKDARLKMQAVEMKAEKVASELSTFSFEQLERKLYQKKTDAIKLKYNYVQKINDLEEKGKLSTAESYSNSLTSIIQFSNENITFYDITKAWLKKYEESMRNSGASYNTVGNYLRSLRSLFNLSIARGDIKKDIYPFGKDDQNKYKIPKSKVKKKALNSIQLRTLFHAKPKNQQQRISKDFWFFLYACSGPNVKDILLLKGDNIKEDTISFYRAKTEDTTDEKEEITIHLNSYAMSHIINYGNIDAAASEYIFPQLQGLESYESIRRKVKNFTRFINQHIGILCQDNELPKVTTNWARHSWATNAIRKGASMEFVQEGLGHSDMKTTKIYFSGFEDQTKKEFANKLMDF